MHPQRLFLLYVVSNSRKRYWDCKLPCIEAQIELSSTFVYDQKLSTSGSSARNSHLSPGGTNDNDAHVCGELAGMRLGRGILLWSYLLHINDVLIKSRAPVSRVKKFELSLSSCCHYLLNSKSNRERWEFSFFTLITGWVFFYCSWGNEFAGNLCQNSRE